MVLDGCDLSQCGIRSNKKNEDTKLHPLIAVTQPLA